MTHAFYANMGGIIRETYKLNSILETNARESAIRSKSHPTTGQEDSSVKVATPAPSAAAAAETGESRPPPRPNSLRATIAGGGSQQVRHPKVGPSNTRPSTAQVRSATESVPVNEIATTVTARWETVAGPS